MDNDLKFMKIAVEEGIRGRTKGMSKNNFTNLTIHDMIISWIFLIASTKTSKGLKVQCRFDKNNYPKGIKVSDKKVTL